MTYLSALEDLIIKTSLLERQFQPYPSFHKKRNRKLVLDWTLVECSSIHFSFAAFRAEYYEVVKDLLGDQIFNALL